MPAPDIGQRYRDYVSCLNRRRWASFGEFVHEKIIFNELEMSMVAYRQTLEDTADTIPDLQYGIQLLLVSGEHVAARLLFNCVPAQTFLGFAPTGKQISFSENVFYRFSGGKIAQVWSVLDKAAIERQLNS